MQEKNLTPAELKAVEEHKYFMSLEQSKEILIEDAIQDFIAKYESDWKKEKLRRENLEQTKEIERHKYIRSEQAGYDIGELAAAEEWRQKYAHIWREEHESLEKNDFLSVKVTVQNEKGIHMRPSSSLARVANSYDCDVYLHKKEMEHYNFLLDGKSYVNIKSIINLLSVAAAPGEELEIIATGKQAKECLAAVEELVNNKFGEGED